MHKEQFTYSDCSLVNFISLEEVGAYFGINACLLIQSLGLLLKA